jgi:hypothetical protein
LDLDAVFESADIPRPKTKARKVVSKHKARRFNSETDLEKALPWDFAPGDCYHVISGGDIDSLTYLRFVARQQPIDYCMLSTWCMAKADLEDIEHLIVVGRIKRIDFYVGEIFKGSYFDVWKLLVEMMQRRGGRADDLEPRLKEAFVSARETWIEAAARLARELPDDAESREAMLRKELEDFLRGLAEWAKADDSLEDESIEDEEDD